LRLRWTRAASHDLDSIEEYIAGDNPRAAIDTVLQIVQHVAMLAQHPGMGRPGRVEGTRELVIAGLPYVIPYLHEGDTVTVLRVLHGAMKWPKRL
jgi:toxin ParE1/3/4